jgi:hypothetical protein
MVTGKEIAPPHYNSDILNVIIVDTMGISTAVVPTGRYLGARGPSRILVEVEHRLIHLCRLTHLLHLHHLFSTLQEMHSPFHLLLHHVFNTPQIMNSIGCLVVYSQDFPSPFSPSGIQKNLRKPQHLISMHFWMKHSLVRTPRGRSIMI